MSADHLSQQSASHLEVATGADRARTYGGLDGSGVGIAILDSGIMASHSEFGNLGNLLGLSRSPRRLTLLPVTTNLAQFYFGSALLIHSSTYSAWATATDMATDRTWLGTAARSLERQRRNLVIQRHSPQRESHRRRVLNTLGLGRQAT